MVRRPAGPVRARSRPAARCSPPRRWAPTSPISARRSSPRPKRARPRNIRQAICEGGAADIVTSALFTGVSGNYLRKSIVAAGLDPDNLPQPGPDAMNFQSATGAKAWRDIWGSGQGIGVIDKVTPAAELIARLAREYAEAKARVCA